MSEKKESKRLQVLPGMKDWLPPESRRLQTADAICRRVMETFGYADMRTPLLEQTQLFARAIGGTTDIVEKEMYTFSDREKRLLTLRPEGTASAVRSYIENSVHKREPVTRWYYSGPMFRHERAQRGRYRQFYQIGAEAIGVDHPGIDAEMLVMLLRLFEAVGLDAVTLKLNTLGCVKCRPAYRQSLLRYLEPQRAALCENCKTRIDRNPLRVLDCKNAACRHVAKEAPRTLEEVCDDCGVHWRAVLADLDALEVGYHFDHRLVRGLDYYTRTTFELLSDAGRLGSQNTIVGGGRYDGLVEQLGGPPTPAIGFALGYERLLLALPEDRPVVPRLSDLCFVTRGDQARRAALPLARDLRKQGVGVDVEHRGNSIKSQMKRAGKLGVPLVVLIGEAELEHQTVTLRLMDSSTQEELPSEQLVARVAEILAS